MADTAIEWADRVWNPTTGCDRVSPGCDHCYALTMAKRLKGMGSAKYQRDGDPRTSGPGFGLSVHPDTLSLPLKWQKPQRIFVNSMSDLFHDQVPDDYIARVFAVMAYAYRHTFQILTKRHGRMRSLLTSSRFIDLFDREFCKIPDWNDRWPDLDYAPAGHIDHLMDGPLTNVHGGVSAEDQKTAELRIPALIQTPLAVRFVSAEPLLGPLDLSRWIRPHTAECLAGDGPPWCTCGRELDGYIDWVIVGGESGRGARPMHPDWARSLRDQCVDAGVSFLFKQWGEYTAEVVSLPLSGDPAIGMRRVGKKAAGRELDGRTWDEYPQAVTHG